MEETVLLKDVIPDLLEVHPAFEKMYLTLINRDNIYAVEVPTLGLNAFALTREVLLVEIKEQFEFLWEHYACEKDEKLSEDARLIASNLRNAFKVKSSL